jgi:hypothetical protein
VFRPSSACAVDAESCAPAVPRSCSLSDTPARWFPGFGPTAGSGLPLLTRFTFSACRAPYPGGSMLGTSRSDTRLPARDLPSHRTGLPGPNYRSASTVRLFQVGSSFTHVTARRFAHPPYVGLVGRLRRRPLPGDAASQLLRHTDVLLRRDLHPLVFRAVRAHNGVVFLCSSVFSGHKTSLRAPTIRTNQLIRFQHHLRLAEGARQAPPGTPPRTRVVK